MLAMAAVAMSPWLLPSSPHTSFNVAAVLLAPAFFTCSSSFSMGLQKGLFAWFKDYG